ncbi:MAG TPA: Arm DNA-binding domain-containing protein [Rhizomicrobium sp.]|nr:Arm DNA-binding domain-containing protein [Rhizomicrobium sp.]
MARDVGRLTALKVDKTKNPGMYADGGGLYLRVTDEGTKNWVLRFMLAGRLARFEQYIPHSENG